MPSKTSKKEEKKRESSRLAAFILTMKNSFKGYWRQLLVGFLLVVAALVIVVAIVLGTNGVEDSSTKPRDTISGGEKERHPLTGELLDRPLEKLPAVFAVMVENAADAWPLSGVNDAFMVIEAPVEAGIPRFVVFLSEEDEIDQLGPVRSARPYYLDWASSFGAIYAHVGGSPEAISQLRSKPITDLDQFFQSEYFWRSNGAGRFAPHNVYTSSELLKEALEEFPQEPNYDVLPFDELEDADGFEEAVEIDIDFAQGSTYDLSWEYADGTYTRYQNGRLFEMTDGESIEVQNVVVLYSEVRSVDAVDRKSVLTEGFGDAVLYRDGKMIPVVWRKTSEGEQIELVNELGEIVPYAPGKIWMHVLNG